MDRLRGVPFLASTVSRSEPLQLFPVGLTEDEVYILPVPITLNDLKDQI
jgi:hypothetical protein